jgi:hypothetical protein
MPRPSNASVILALNPASLGDPMMIMTSIHVSLLEFVVCHEPYIGTVLAGTRRYSATLRA